MNLVLREIRPSDNAGLAVIIRNALAEFGANRPGTVYFDPTTDHLYDLFRNPQSRYFVAEENGHLLGGGGIYPTEGLPPDTCELVKMYLRPDSRGRGLGRQLMEACLAFARSSGFRKVYIETMPELRQALKVYEQFGFTYLGGPLGNSGHYGCDRWMIKDLEEAN